MLCAESLSCVRLFATPWTPTSVHGDSLGKNTGVGCHAFLQGGSSQPRERTQVSCIAGRFFPVCVIREATRKFRVVVFKLQEIRWGFLIRTQTGKIWGWFLPWTLNLRGTEHSSCPGMSSMKFSEPFQCLGPARASSVILEGCPSLDNTVRFQVQHSSLEFSTASTQGALGLIPTCCPGTS